LLAVEKFYIIGIVLCKLYDVSVTDFNVVSAGVFFQFFLSSM